MIAPSHRSSLVANINNLCRYFVYLFDFFFRIVPTENFGFGQGCPDHLIWIREAQLKTMKSNEKHFRCLANPSTKSINNSHRKYEKSSAQSIPILNAPHDNDDTTKKELYAVRVKDYASNHHQPKYMHNKITYRSK